MPGSSQTNRRTLSHADLARLDAITIPQYRGPFHLPPETSKVFVLKLASGEDIDDFLQAISDPSRTYKITDINHALNHLHQAATRFMPQSGATLQRPTVLLHPNQFARDCVFRWPMTLLTTHGLGIEPSLAGYALIAFDIALLFNPTLLSPQALPYALLAISMTPFVITSYIVDSTYKNTVRGYLQMPSTRHEGQIQQGFNRIFARLAQNIGSYTSLNEIIREHGITLHKTPRWYQEPSIYYAPIAIAPQVIFSPWLYTSYLLNNLTDKALLNQDTAHKQNDYALLGALLKFTGFYGVLMALMLNNFVRPLTTELTDDPAFALYLNCLLSTWVSIVCIESTAALPAAANEACTKVTSWARGRAPYMPVTDHNPDADVEAGAGEDARPQPR